MEVYILDSLYRRTAIIDIFESMIWTERFSSKGDFEWDLPSTIETRSQIVEGIRLATDVSARVMTVETVQDVTDTDGKRTLKVSGPSLESILEQRAALAALSDLTTDPNWVITDDPMAIANKLFHDICVTGVLNAGDIIAGVTEDSIFPDDTIDPPTGDVTVTIAPTTLYTALKELCDSYSMGFRLVRDRDTSMLYFDVYMGSDRTTQQTVLPAVIFSPDLENLQNTNKLSSSALYKNVAYVISPVGHAVVYADVDPAIAGFERRVMLVVADDITDPDGPTATSLMISRGQSELAKNRQFTALDGELAGNSNYQYDSAYYLGDLVEVRDDDGAVSLMQVTEQIFVHDKEGFRSYPTLATVAFVTPGSWLDMDPTVVWDDYTTEHWADL